MKEIIWIRYVFFLLLTRYRGVGLLLALVLALPAIGRAQADFNTQKQLYFFNVWGFLKYHHPALAGGSIPADTLFLQYLPALEAAQSQREANGVFTALLKQVGTPAGGQSLTSDPPEASLLQRNLNDRWRTRSRFLNGENRRSLSLIYERRFTGEKHHYTYVPSSFYGGTMPNEPAYTFPKEENVPYRYRMLALAKLKAFVDYLYPHKYLLSQNWDQTIEEYLPLFEAAETRLEYEYALLTLNARLQDTHAYPFFRQLLYKDDIFKNQYFPPFDYRLVGKQVVVTQIIDPALCRRSNILVGDVLVEIDEQPIDVWVEALNGVLSASNPTALWARVGEWGDNLLFRSADQEMKVLIFRGNRDFISANLQLMNPAEPEKAKLIDAYFKKRLTPAKKKPELRRIGKDIVYFQINDTERLTADVPLDRIDARMDSLMARAVQSKGIIFDLRLPPDNSDFVYEQMYRKFATGDNFFARYYLLNPNTPGSYMLLTRPEAYFPATAQPEGLAYGGKVVILVGGGTQGVGEWMAMNLQHLFPEALTIGEQTAGADGDVKRITLPGPYTLELTGNAVFYPDMAVTQHRGIRLNEEVPATMKGYLEKRDEALDRALEIIRGQR